MKPELTIALAGNPNCGKTSIFNELTGSKQHVGNWPGVTVEKKEGSVKFADKNINIIDLPGIYSLGAYSEDEVVAIKYLLEEKPDLIINVVDAGNIERNLYLTLQLLELNAQVVIALNMVDEAKKKNITIDKDKLSKILDVPIIETIATKNSGINELLAQSIEAFQSKGRQFAGINWGDSISEERNKISKLLKDRILFKSEKVIKNEELLDNYDTDWVALKILENNEFIKARVFEKGKTEELKELLEKSNKAIIETEGCESEASIIDKRYTYVAHLMEACVKRESNGQDTLTDKIDKIATGKWTGIPIFVFVMFLLYQITMSFGNDFLGSYLQLFFDFLGALAAEKLASSPALWQSFIKDAVIGGLGSVLVFVPLMFTMFFIISFLEDSGYMARAAYVMDRFMHNVLGLHGKTAVSMIVSSGCNVAGIMSTRTLENKKDRMIAILINPFISCSARLPVYALFAGAFFQSKIGILPVSGLVVFSLYLLGIIVATLAGKVLSKTIFKQEESYFIMELPPYRIPTLKSLLIHMWEKTEAFIQKAGTVLFGIIILIWALSILPLGVEPGSIESYLGSIGNLIAPVFRLAGFGFWQSGVALLTGIGAKESIIATLGTVFSASEDTQLAQAIQHYFTPLSAYAFMVMSLLYSPCAATIMVIKKETNSIRWALFSVIYSFVIGWTAAVLVYQIGSIMGIK